MVRIFDNGEFWFKVEKNADMFFLYRRSPSKTNNVVADQEDWEQIDINREFNHTHQALIHQINVFFGTNFQLKKNEVIKKIYVDDHDYFRVLFENNKIVLEKAGKTEEAKAWEKDFISENIKNTHMDDKVYKAIESTLKWEVIYKDGRFFTQLPRHLLSRLNAFFEIKL